MRKRCQRGKSCGATCISKSKVCLKGLAAVRDDVAKVRSVLEGGKSLPAKVNKPQDKDGNKKELNTPSDKVDNGLPSGSQSERAKYTLNYLYDPDVKSKDVDGELSASKINWRAGVEDGSKFVGKGASADFVTVQPDSLARGLQSQFPNGVGIKYGKVSDEEVSLSKKIGESGAGPRLIAAKLEDKGGSKAVQGMIALERIPGKTVDAMIDEGKVSRVALSDAYLRGLSMLHKAGISHGDAHFSNAIYQPNGKVRFIDFGFSKDDPAKAFSEALRRGLSAQTRGEVQDKIRNNFSRVLQKLGRSDIKSEIELRLELDSIFPKSDPNRNRVLMELIDLLYEGV